MHWFARVIIVIGGNALALWIANLYVPGFILTPHWGAIILIALILSLLNFLLKPLLTLAFGPVIILTLGIALIIVNAIILYLLVIITTHIDLLSGSIMIQTIPALFLATLVISAVNFVIHLAL
jgi:putative membrane protein